MPRYAPPCPALPHPDKKITPKKQGIECHLTVTKKNGGLTPVKSRIVIKDGFDFSGAVDQVRGGYHGSLMDHTCVAPSRGRVEGALVFAPTAFPLLGTCGCHGRAEFFFAAAAAAARL
jgi:hypothetical protein